LEADHRVEEMAMKYAAGRVDFGTDIVRNQSDKALPVRRKHHFSGICQTTRQPVDPQSTVGVEHYLDDGRIFEKACDSSTKRGAKHARTARNRFRLNGMMCHRRPQRMRPSRAASDGDD